MISRSKATFKDNYKHYFVTIQKPQKKEYVDATELHMVKKELKSKMPTMQVYKSTLELGKEYKQLHLHLLMRIAHSVYFKNYSKINGMRLYWRPIYNISGIDSYLSKDIVRYTQQDIKNLNFYNHFYGFI